MYSFTITINGEDVTAYACYPFSGELTLDRSLDQAYIELKASPRSKPYPPFSEVVVTPNPGEATIFVIASDEVETIIKTGLSNHRILLCEETKKLERVICPGKTFVQPLVKNYSTDVQSPPQEISTISLQNLAEQAGLTNYIDTRYQLYELSNNDLFAAQNVNATVFLGENTPKLSDTVSITSSTPYKIIGYAIVAENRFGEITTLARSNSYLGEQPYSQISGYSLDISGKDLPIGGYNLTYLINIGFRQSDANPPAVYNMAAVYDMAVIPISQTQKPPLYITDVTQQLLEIAEPIRRGETPRFTLDSETAARYATTPCNELNFANGATLRENLDEIAGIVHCITRLKNGKIFFDKLGEPDAAATAALGTPVSVRSSANIEKYATHLDSFVDNLMNAQDPKQGAISDPFFGIYKTPRALISTTDARVTVKNCRIDTVFGIQKLEKVTVLYNDHEYDITAFVYEKKEYDLLETNTGVYPYAKAYALYYTQGQKGIDGLTHRVETATQQPFQNPAIANILSIVTGQTLDWKSDAKGNDILNYAFNVTYISAVRGRVRAVKQNIKDFKTPSVMAFNQSAPRLSSVNYGERLKGETAMLSEPEVHLVFKTQNLSAVMDSVGKLYTWENERYYISKVSYKIWRDYIIAETTLSQKFNQLGRYVSVNNSFRQFEVDDNSQEECIVYEDYAVFSFEEPNVYKSTFDDFNVRLALRDTIAPLYTGEVAGNHEISICHATTHPSNNHTDILSDVILPVQSIALGNSLLFNFAFQDNYSAGKFLQPQAGYKLTREAPYGDPLYGEAKYLSFSLEQDVKYRDSGTAVEVGDVIPLATNKLMATTVFHTADRPLIINKSSRDAPNITYQIHHVTDSNIVFGKALTASNPLVSYFGKHATFLVALPFELNPLAPPIPNNYDYGHPPLRVGYNINGVEYQHLPAEKITHLNVDFYNTKFASLKIDLNRAFQSLKQQDNYSGGVDPKSFAIIGNNAAEFIIGANATEFMDDSSLKPLFIYLKHTI